MKRVSGIGRKYNLPLEMLVIEVWYKNMLMAQDKTKFLETKPTMITWQRFWKKRGWPMKIPWTKDINSVNFILNRLLLFDKTSKITTVLSNVSTIDKSKIFPFAARRTHGIYLRWKIFNSVSNRCSSNPITDYFTKLNFHNLLINFCQKLNYPLLSINGNM